jgi:hypothetical protein
MEAHQRVGGRVCEPPVDAARYKLRRRRNLIGRHIPAIFGRLNRVFVPAAKGRRGVIEAVILPVKAALAAKSGRPHEAQGQNADPHIMILKVSESALE